ncbi:phosphatidylinositol n-acetylglucosaminyltransferase subunit [Cystoisospora suis]|uniref:Phosphatidylinositol n-acetylglucosaminyltransferase subunit n=1 Tax=Cystoisospora suis TaxID=483139 RepID=A0A2C6LC79_9APIC|nr:phosphatidylinositol n-acetylglucosaminyltransferase subunit [Cystoisospora suis]
MNAVGAGEEKPAARTHNSDRTPDERANPQHVTRSAAQCTPGKKPFFYASPCLTAAILKAANCPKCSRLRRRRFPRSSVEETSSLSRQRQEEGTAWTHKGGGGDGGVFRCDGESEEQRNSHQEATECLVVSSTPRYEREAVKGDTGELHFRTGSAEFASSIRSVSLSSCRAVNSPQVSLRCTSFSYCSPPASSSHSSPPSLSPPRTSSPALSLSPSSHCTFDTARSAPWPLPCCSQQLLSSPAGASSYSTPFPSIFFPFCGSSPPPFPAAGSLRFTSATSSARRSPTGLPPSPSCNFSDSPGSGASSSVRYHLSSPLYGCLCAQSRRLHPRSHAFFYASPWREDHRIFRISTSHSFSSLPFSAGLSFFSSPAPTSSTGVRLLHSKAFLSAVRMRLFCCLRRREKNIRALRGLHTGKHPEASISQESAAHIGRVSSLNLPPANEAPARESSFFVTRPSFVEGTVAEEGANSGGTVMVSSLLLFVFLLSSGILYLSELLLCLQRIFFSVVWCLRTFFLSVIGNLLVIGQHQDFSRTLPSSAIVVGFISLSCACLVSYLLFSGGPYIVEESLEVVANFGVQLQRKTRWGSVHREFIRASKVRDILLNESIQISDVIFYLAILAEDQANLVVPFQHFAPGLDVNLIIYETLHHLLGVGGRSVHTS